MSATTEDAKNRWIERVLQVRVPAAGNGAATAGFRQRWQAAAASWRDANDQVGAQISALQASLRGSGDPELIAIAEYGVNQMTDGHKVPLMAAIMAVDAAPDPVDPALLQRARQAAAGLREQIAADERIAACDDNPFGVAVSIRATFGAALAALQAIL